MLEATKRVLVLLGARLAKLHAGAPLAPPAVADFLSAALGTLFATVVSTPQTLLCDRIMSGMYPNLPVALGSLLRDEGAGALYQAWRPAVCSKAGCARRPAY